MWTIYSISLVSTAAIAMAICSSLFVTIILKKFRETKLRDSRRNAAGITDDHISKFFACDGLAKNVLMYMVKCSYNLQHASNSFMISKRFLRNNEFSNKLQNLTKKANLPKSFTKKDYLEVQFRLSIFIGLIAFILGSLFSVLFSVLLLLIGVFIGLGLQKWAMKKEVNYKSMSVEKNMPEMLDVVALGLRSGLTFDRSLKIYTQYFSNDLARSFLSAQQKWEGGLLTRDQALRDLSFSYNSTLFERVIENIIRALRFGSSLEQHLEDAASEARLHYKTKQEEKVSKAPVKMMIPTGTLILPAMLILVLGPILLELIIGF